VPGIDINDAEAANLDFGALQALISQQMASIEAEWEPDLGGRPPSNDFLRDELTTDFREQAPSFPAPSFPEPSRTAPADFRPLDADLPPVSRPQMPALPGGRDVAERGGKREWDEDVRRVERRSVYRPRHTYSGRSGGEPVAATLNLQYAVPPDAFPEEEKPTSRRTPRGGAGAGAGGDRFAYRRARRAEDANALDA
jgi:hypothetical protein